MTTTMPRPSARRPPLVVGRCRRCFVRMARRGHGRDWLCSSCAGAAATAVGAATQRAA